MKNLFDIRDRVVAELRGERGLQAQPDPVVVENRYNPTLEYRNYMIPALMIIM